MNSRQGRAAGVSFLFQVTVLAILCLLGLAHSRITTDGRRIPRNARDLSASPTTGSGISASYASANPPLKFGNATREPSDPLYLDINKGNQSEMVFSKYLKERTYDASRLYELVTESVDAFEQLRVIRGASLDDIFNDHWQLCINNGMEMMFDTTAEEDPQFQARYGMILDAMKSFNTWGRMWELAGQKPSMTWWTILVGGNEAVIGWVDDGKQTHGGPACQHHRLHPSDPTQNSAVATSTTTDGSRRGRSVSITGAGSPATSTPNSISGSVTLSTVAAQEPSRSSYPDQTALPVARR